MSANTSSADHSSAYISSDSTTAGDSPASNMRSGAYKGIYSSQARDNSDRRFMSFQDLQHLAEQQHDEILYLRNETNTLKSREIEISSLSVKLQQQFAATQGQIDHLKSTVRLQLLNPVTETEYLKIEKKAESDRDLLDTLKLGIYQQLGSLRAAKDTAVRKASELSLECEQQATQLRVAKQDLHDAQFARENDATEIKRMKLQLENKTNLELEHMSKIKDLEHRLSSVTNEQERAIDARVQLQHRINEAARLEMLLRQEEGSVAKHKASLDCAEQKLDILKSEYYELKLSYSQKVLQLENALRMAEEKLSLVADVELEAEVFIANMASRQERLDASAGGTGDGSSTLAVIPPSRRMAHALTITKKCLALENKVASLEHDLRHKDEVVAKLTQSLEMAKSALAANGSNTQYTLIETTVTKLMADKEALEARNKALLSENTVLTEQVKEQAADLKVLARHREELVLIREQLAAYASGLSGNNNNNASGVGALSNALLSTGARPSSSIMKSPNATATNSVRFADEHNGSFGGGHSAADGSPRGGLGSGGRPAASYGSYNTELASMTGQRPETQREPSRGASMPLMAVPIVIQPPSSSASAVGVSTSPSSFRIQPNAAGYQQLQSAHFARPGQSDFSQGIVIS